MEQYRPLGALGDCKDGRDAAGARTPLLLCARAGPTVVGDWIEEAYRGH